MMNNFIIFNDMSFLYNIGINCYIIVIRIASIINPQARLWLSGRKKLLCKIKKSVYKKKNIVWFHCASLGEFEQAKPVISEYKSINPNHKILLTFFSPSGYELEKNNALADWVFYLPPDTKSNAKEFIILVNPIKAVFVKYEFWFNYIHELKKNKIPIYSVSSVFRSEQLFFKFTWWANQLKNISHFFVQDLASKKLLNSININNVTVSGDTRFDNVLSNSKKSEEIELIKNFCNNNDTIICGSTWPADEKLLIDYISKNHQYKYIIAPHKMNRNSSLQNKTKGTLYSNATEENIRDSRVLIIDNIGNLSKIYKYGTLAYIGGGFGRGIHNLLEASAFGLPVIFGPKYDKFNEAKEIIKLDAGISVASYSELVFAIEKFKDFKNSISIDYVKNNSGATKKILSVL